MLYRTIDHIHLPVSRLVFGCAFPAMLQGKDVSEVLDAAVASGINAFDTAENYGLSEVALGRWIKSRTLRNKIVIITKGGHPYNGKDRVNPKDLTADLEKSFDQLQTDFIDLYLLHRDVLSEEVGPIMELLHSYKKAGRIGSYGCSNWTIERIAQANAYAAEHSLAPLTVSSPQFSLAVQVRDPWGGSGGCIPLSGPSRKADRDWYLANNMPILAYSALGHGMLSGKVFSRDIEGAKSTMNADAVFAYHHKENFERLERAEALASKKGCTVPQIALAYLLCQDLTVFPVIAASKPEHIARNVEALSIKLNREERDGLEGTD